VDLPVTDLLNTSLSTKTMSWLATLHVGRLRAESQVNSKFMPVDIHDADSAQFTSLAPDGVVYHLAAT